MDSRSADKFREHERLLQQLFAATARMDCRQPTIPPVGTIVNIVSGEVYGAVVGTTPFDIDQITLRHGVMPSGVTESSADTISVVNLFTQTYGDNDLVLAFQRDDDSTWYGFNPSGETGSTVGYFELVEDLSLADVSKLAKPIDPDGTRNDAADSVYLLDDDTEGTRFVGYAEYTDADDAAVTHSGYRYFALKITEDYNETGLAGYRIIDGEGPMRMIAVEIVGMGPIDDTTTAIAVSAFDADALLAHGNPDNGRYPEIEGEIGTGVESYFSATDHFGVAKGADDGDKWLVVYHESLAKYVFLRAIDPHYARIRGLVTGDVDRADATFAIDNIEVMHGDDPRSDITSTAETVTVQNTPALMCSDNVLVYATYNNDDSQWEVDGANAELIVPCAGFGLATAAVDSGDATFTVDNVEFTRGDNPDISTGTDTLTLQNDFGWDIDNNGKVYFEESLADGDYYALQAQCPA